MHQNEDRRQTKEFRLHRITRDNSSPVEVPNSKLWRETNEEERKRMNVIRWVAVDCQDSDFSIYSADNKYI